jgi:hypothetical protein
MELGKDWALRTAFHQVVFESALSLRVMIEAAKFNLSEGLAIKFVDCDCPLDFPGYSIQPVNGAHDEVRLVKIS